MTGGARGIGRGCALALARKGFDIALVDLLEPEMERLSDAELAGRTQAFRDRLAKGETLVLDYTLKALDSSGQGAASDGHEADSVTRTPALAASTMTLT